MVRTLKQTRFEQVILSGILPVIGRRGHINRNCRGIAINMPVQKLCREEEFGFVDFRGSFFGEADTYTGMTSSKWNRGSSICGWTHSKRRQCHA